MPWPAASPHPPKSGCQSRTSRAARVTAPIEANDIVGLFVLGVLDNGLDHVNIDNFPKILIRGLILLAALVINVSAQQLRERTAE